MVPQQQRHQQAVQDFQSITGCSRKTAVNFLQSFGFNVERAANAFFEFSPEKQRSFIERGSQSPANVSPDKLVDAVVIDREFERYSDEVPTGNGVISISGLQKLSADLGVGLDDVFFLVFAFSCQCRSQGIITKDEFVKGMKSLHVETIDDLKSLVPFLKDSVFKDHQHLKQVYSFAFTYALEPTQKQIPVDLAIAYWKLLILPLNCCFLDDFIIYMSTASNVKSVTRDVWQMVLEFVITSKSVVHTEDTATRKREIVRIVRDFDEDGAWPLVIDGFVEWMRDKYNVSIEKS